MAQTLRRTGQRNVRRQARGAQAAQKARAAKAQTGGLLDAAARLLPFTEEQLHRFFLGLIFLAVAAIAWLVASLAGIPQMVGQQAAVAVGDAGYEVRRVEVRGVNRMNEVAVYERVLGVRDRSMPLVSLSELRASLLQLPWVADARVSRQLPDTIVVDIVERTPRAVLDDDGALALVDGGGHVLERVSAGEARGRLHIAGEGVRDEVEALDELLGAAPALQPRVVRAEWVGNRRWDLTFSTGQVLALPQGVERARAALLGFARLDGVNRLLGGTVARFDMRNPDRMYLRVPDRAKDAALAKAALAKAGN
ncbi:FtsQ-type POTRA domain-containing protein [Croceibacterium sp. TMG7-5b_MA50]|uniref:cell division protein FtsQ/DivIB n=1 Tax=Croceibacterium sp. TMG7-5b_MA50 TaxID=3121290 RepID=UPI0032218DBB